MDKIKFATLIAYIQSLVMQGNAITHFQVGEIDFQINDGTPAVVIANGEELNTLLKAAADGKLIEAIKAYRVLTGLGLKESKEAVESFMITIPQRQTLRTIAAEMRNALENGNIYNKIDRWISTLDNITG